MKRKTLLQLARWCEDQSRRCVIAADEAEQRKKQRYLRHRGKNFARIASYMRENLRESESCQQSNSG